mmetsp:Transcript_2704/g.8322  ORF Transcript_2704/g.8322 Transcript_2704/m.8322 type:complete len:225 (-) Transcript_2704:953-1627(-)
MVVHGLPPLSHEKHRETLRERHSSVTSMRKAERPSSWQQTRHGAVKRPKPGGRRPILTHLREKCGALEGRGLGKRRMSCMSQLHARRVATRCSRGLAREAATSGGHSLFITKFTDACVPRLAVHESHTRVTPLVRARLLNTSCSLRWRSLLSHSSSTRRRRTTPQGLHAATHRRHDHSDTRGFLDRSWPSSHNVGKKSLHRFYVLRTVATFDVIMCCAADPARG